MFTLATVELALGIINSAVKLGRRVDLIMVEHELGVALPIALPPLEEDISKSVAKMRSFFGSDEGKALLGDDSDWKQSWKDYQQAVQDEDEIKADELAKKLVNYWALLKGETLPRTHPGGAAAPRGKISEVEYYLVGSAKPGHQRSAVVDIALAAADVALEYVGDRPAMITRDPAVQNAIKTFLVHFTEGNLEKLGYRQLFERTLGSVIRTAIEHRDLVEDEKALSLFLDALARAHTANPDFVAGLAAGKGFDKLLQSLLKTIGENLGQFTNNTVAVDIIGGILNDVAQEKVFKAILEGENAALATVAQIAISHVAKHPVLLKQAGVGGDEIWHSVLTEVLKQVDSSAEKRTLFTDAALGSLLSAALRGVAQNKELLKGGFVEHLVASVAGSLSTASMKELFGEGNLKIIASAVLEAAARHVDMLAKDDKLLGAILGAVMKEGAAGFKEGFDRDFATNLAIAAIDAVAANAASIKLPEAFGEILATVLKELSRDDLRKNLARGDFLEIFGDLVQVLAANPHLWEATLANGKIPASVVRSIAQAIATDPTHLLKGPVLASLLVEVLSAVSQRAKIYLVMTAEGANQKLSELLSETLKRLEREVGVSIAADNIVPVIVQMVLEWGKDQFEAKIGEVAFEQKIKNALLAA